MNQFCLSLELNDKYQYQYYPTTGWDDGKMLLMLLRQNLFLQKNRSNTSQMEKYLFEPVVLVGSQAESTNSRTLKTCHVAGSQPEDKAFSELLAQNLLGVTS